MSAGIPRFVTVNLQELNTKFQDGEQVDLDTLQQKGLLNLSGREASLPLKVCFTTHSCTCFLLLHAFAAEGRDRAYQEGEATEWLAFRAGVPPPSLHCSGACPRQHESPCPVHYSASFAQYVCSVFMSPSDLLMPRACWQYCLCSIKHQLIGGSSHMQSLRHCKDTSWPDMEMFAVLLVALEVTEAPATASIGPRR